jgi:ADP-heptose:LPS heptosyltransferase
MGLGGYLAWTAVAREIKKRSSDSVKILPIEKHGSFIKIIDSEIFLNNNDFISVSDKTGEHYIFPLVLNNPDANYCKKDTYEKAYHKSDKHIIEQYCDVYGISDPVLKCYIDINEESKNIIDSIVENEIENKKFIAIEPISKENYTKNRKYPFEKWQNIVNSLKDDICIVQVGVKGSKVLDNVIDLTGKTSFTNTAGIIGRSDLFLSSEGGLVHAATAFDTKSLVIITGYQSLKMVAYPQNINIDISSHGPCGMKIDCPLCIGDRVNHEWKDIVQIIRNELCL